MPATPIFIFLIYTDGPKKKRRVEPAVRRWWVKQAGAWPDRLVLRMHNCWRLRKLTQAVITTRPLIRWALERRRVPVPPAKGTTPTDVSHSHWGFFFCYNLHVDLTLDSHWAVEPRRRVRRNQELEGRSMCAKGVIWRRRPQQGTRPQRRTRQQKLVPPRWRQQGSGSRNFFELLERFISDSFGPLIGRLPVTWRLYSAAWMSKCTLRCRNNSVLISGLFLATQLICDNYEWWIASVYSYPADTRWNIGQVNSASSRTRVLRTIEESFQWTNHTVGWLHKRPSGAQTHEESSLVSSRTDGLTAGSLSLCADGHVWKSIGTHCFH